MRINLHVIVIGAGLTGSFFLKEMIAYLHMKQENLIRTDITVFDPGSISKEDLGAVYIREDLGQNRALLLSELLKEQYDYEVTAVPGDFSVGSPRNGTIFFKYGREKRRFCLEAFGKNVFGEPCHVKDCGRL